MKKVFYAVLLLAFFYINGCSSGASRVSGEWKTNVPRDAKIALENIKKNNSNIGSFIARFYLTESKKRMALSGQLYFGANEGNFFFTMTDVLVKSKVLSMKKYKNRVLIVFHRENRSYVEDAAGLDLSKYKFEFSLTDLLYLISLKIPVYEYNKLLYNKDDAGNHVLRIIKNRKHQDVFIDKSSGRVKKIVYFRKQNKYSINYVSYNEGLTGFYYPETVKILNYSIRQRILIKIESIAFVNIIPEKVFRF